MLKVEYINDEVQVSLGGTTSVLEELGRPSGSWTLNVITNVLRLCGVEYESYGVVYNKGQKGTLKFFFEDAETGLLHYEPETDKDLDAVRFFKNCPSLTKILQQIGEEV